MLIYFQKDKLELLIYFNFLCLKNIEKWMVVLWPSKDRSTDFEPKIPSFPDLIFSLILNYI